MIRKWVLALRRLYVLPIRLYRRFLSPAKGMPTCRFTPTCSAYAIEAVMEWGIVCGSVLALWRLIRCNPFSKGGFDPVPLCPWSGLRPEAGTLARKERASHSGEDSAKKK